MEQINEEVQHRTNQFNISNDMSKLKQNIDAMGWLIRNSKSVTDTKFSNMIDAFKIIASNV